MATGNSNGIAQAELGILIGTMNHCEGTPTYRETCNKGAVANLDFSSCHRSTAPPYTHDDYFLPFFSQEKGDNYQLWQGLGRIPLGLSFPCLFIITSLQKNTDGGLLKPGSPSPKGVVA